MEAYSESGQDKIFEVYEKTRSWISTWLGVFATILGIGVIFVVASLEGTREIQVQAELGAKLLNIWREESGESIGFPEDKATIVTYDGRDYFFVDNNGDWYFAYNGGLEYIFGDYKYYLLTGITMMVALSVGSINYTTTIRNITNTNQFKKTLVHYKEKKQKIEPYSQYLTDFCIYKNQQTLEMAKRDIVETAGLSYNFYNSEDFNYKSLSEWQKKALKKLKNIKIKKIRSTDLLQEHGDLVGQRVISILPSGQQEHQRNFLLTSFFSRLASTALSGTVVSFGVVLGNWYLGLAYGLSVLISFVSAIVVATDYGTTTLRNRYIGKADLLSEFYNLKDKFIQEEKQREAKKAEVEQQKQEVKLEEKQVEEKKNEIIHLPIVQKVV